ncbi:MULTISPECIES: FRG domain-containing protein [Enterococcus]|uniref:FRG domain-containing protein n=1 Tax=Enterococcus TaxID=1350 RepID=UPI00372D152A
MENKTLDYIDKIIENIEKQKSIIPKKFLKNPIVCFRGESADYGSTKLMPSLFRQTSGISMERELIELFSDYEISDLKDTTGLAKSIAGQHYVQTSRLLDITFSILPALYFASDNENEDGYIYSFIFPEVFSPHSSYLNNYYDNMVAGKIVPSAKDFKVISHSYNNERLKMQSGGFILFSGETFSRIPKEYYLEPVLIEKSDKKKIRDNLKIYFNINESTLFPEKDKRKSSIDSRLSSMQKNTVLLQDYRESELEYFYRRIEFEVEMKKKLGNESVKDIRRFLRKEKLNIVNFINENYLSTTSEEIIKKEEHLKNIDYRFFILDAEVR